MRWKDWDIVVQYTIWLPNSSLFGLKAKTYKHKGVYIIFLLGYLFYCFHCRPNFKHRSAIVTSSQSEPMYNQLRII